MRVKFFLRVENINPSRKKVRVMRVRPILPSLICLLLLTNSLCLPVVVDMDVDVLASGQIFEVITNWLCKYHVLKLYPAHEGKKRIGTISNFNFLVD